MLRGAVVALGDGVRRNVLTVAVEERTRLKDAIVRLHTEHRYPGLATDPQLWGGVTWWFKQDEIHAASHVHGCPAFLPWHRELINRFEDLIRAVDPELSLHYWDWTQDPAPLFTNDFMGTGTPGVAVEAGDPWLTAGFYDPNPANTDVRSDDEFDPNYNPLFPPRHLTRDVGVHTNLNLLADDNDLLDNSPDFPTFDQKMEGLHGNAHFYIGGTILDAHTSFRDPFVFLLHSNVDRLWAMWQRRHGHVDPGDLHAVYGADATSTGSGDILTGANWGIKSPLEPWAGPGAQNTGTGIVAHVRATRPWASPDDEQLNAINQKDSTHPTVVIPRAYDTAPRDALIITDRDTFSSYEVQATADYPSALYVIYDGFTSNDLPAAPGPTFSFHLDSAAGVATTQLTAASVRRELEDPSGAPDVPQRVTFTCDLHFADSMIFGFAGDSRDIIVQADDADIAAHATLRLINQPNPYMLDGPVSWLSTDLRVFQIRPHAARAGITQQDPDVDPAAPTQFISSLITAFNGLPDDASHPFHAISTDQTASELELSRTVNGVRVLNYAVAKVRYRANTVSANNVRVFFRAFSTMLSALDYNTFTNYRRSPGPSVAPLLGLIDGEVASIPFFASARIDTATQEMAAQTDIPNEQPINPIPGQEATAYFGCWFDFNQTDPQFPANPTSDGHFVARLPISQLIRGHHQCLVAEIFFQPSGADPIPVGATPASSDRLAQRNLAIVESDNPGGAASHTVQHTFIVKNVARTETRAAVVAPRSELVIHWNNVPRDAIASLYSPQWSADDILQLANLRQHPATLSRLDDHTVACRIADISFIPLPAGAQQTYAGLLSIVLPQHVWDGQMFHIDVQQFADLPTPGIMKLAAAAEQRPKRRGRKTTSRPETNGTEPPRYVVGSFRITIPVRLRETLLHRETRKLAALRYTRQGIPTTSRWVPIFERYLAALEAKVTGLGGDPTTIPASLDDPHITDATDGELCSRTGHVTRVFYDCVGAFEGFELQDCDNTYRYDTREPNIETLVRSLCPSRGRITVCTETKRIRRLIIEC
jgi:hypothetical protein